MGPSISKKGKDFIDSLSTERKFFHGGELIPHTIDIHPSAKKEGQRFKITIPVFCADCGEEIKAYAGWDDGPTINLLQNHVCSTPLTVCPMCGWKGRIVSESNIEYCPGCGTQ